MAKFLWNAGPRINADMVALGRKPMNEQSFINQIMKGAKLIEQTENCRVFTDAKGKYRLEVSLTNNVVERLMKKTAIVDGEKVEFHGQYTATTHAIERFRERFVDNASNKTDAQINRHLNELLKTATLHSTTSNLRGLVHNYDSFKQNMRIIVAKNTLSIVTVHQLVEEKQSTPIIEKDSPLFAVIVETTKRELGKARRAFRKTNRELTEQLASIQIEMAHAMVNKTRAKGEHIVSAVERKMNELAEQERSIVARLDAEKAKFERVEADAGKVIGGAN